jgi:hypothetical protein
MSEGALVKGRVKVGLEAPTIVGIVKLIVEEEHDPVVVFAIPSV